MKKRRIIIISIFLVVVLAIVSFFLFRKDKVEYLTVELKKQDLFQTINEIGTVKASKEISLNFSQVGKLSALHVNVGDQVLAGDILAELDYSSLLIKKEESLSALSMAQANYDKLLKGASSQEIAILEAQLNQADSAYNSAVEDLLQLNKLINENINQAEKALSDLRDPKVSMAIKQAVSSAQINLDNVKKSSQQNIVNSKTSLLSSLAYNFSVAKNSLDAVKRILDDDDIKNVFSVKNYLFKTETERSYDRTIDSLDLISETIVLARNTQAEADIKIASDNLLSLLDDVFVVLNNCFSALENSITSSSFSQASLDSFKTSVSNNKTSVNTAISSLQSSYFSYNNALLNSSSNISSAEDALKTAQANLSDAILNAENSLSVLRLNSNQQKASAQSRLDSAKKSYNVVASQLANLKAPAKIEDLRLAQAQLDQAQSSLDFVEKQIEDSIIKAPINGKVVAINYEIGEQVLNSKTFLSLLAEGDFEVEIFVSEADISKLKLFNEAKISFDAFGGDYLVGGKVYFIDPAATNIFDVIYYRVKIIFDENSLSSDFVIKAGMTANVDIIANFKKDVLAVPSRAVLSRNGEENYVRVLESKNIKEIPVSLGIRADQAMLEISSEDLNEGDLIVTSIKNN